MCWCCARTGHSTRACGRRSPCSGASRPARSSPPRTRTTSTRCPSRWRRRASTASYASAWGCRCMTSTSGTGAPWLTGSPRRGAPPGSRWWASTCSCTTPTCRWWRPSSTAGSRRAWTWRSTGWTPTRTTWATAFAQRTACWCPAGSAAVGWRARSRRPASRARRAFRTSGSASACRWPSSSTRGTCAEWMAPTPPSSTSRLPTRSSTCSPSSARSRSAGARCAWAGERWP